MINGARRERILNFDAWFCKRAGLSQSYVGSLHHDMQTSEVLWGKVLVLDPESPCAGKRRLGCIFSAEEEMKAVAMQYHQGSVYLSRQQRGN